MRASYLGEHLPTNSTAEVSRLAAQPRCKLEITAIKEDPRKTPREDLGRGEPRLRISTA